MALGGGKTKMAVEMGMQEELVVGRFLKADGKEGQGTRIMLRQMILYLGLAQRRT